MKKRSHTIRARRLIRQLNVVDSSLDGPNGLPSVATNLTIEGEGGLIIARNAASAAGFRIFHVQATGKLTLNRVTVRNGWLLCLRLQRGSGVRGWGVMAWERGRGEGARGRGGR